MDIPMLPNLDFFEKMAEAAAKETLSRFRQNVAIENKYTVGFDPVTEADKAAERAIRAVIEAKYPEHGILGEEEENVNLDHEFTWVIDPIDGTRGFITGLPVWGTLIGLYQNGQAIMGMMDQPFTGERFMADTKDSYLRFRGADLQKLSSSNCKEIADASMFTAAPDLLCGIHLERYTALQTAVKLPRYGCDCYAFSMLAMGSVDIVVEAGVQPYDVGGLISLVENAGGVFSTWTGGRAENGGDVIASATPELHEKALAYLNP
jgi:histidinol phosphatase-like enzyme (inositol monophosphatase family)